MIWYITALVYVIGAFIAHVWVVKAEAGAVGPTAWALFALLWGPVVVILMFCMLGDLVANYVSKSKSLFARCVESLSISWINISELILKVGRWK